MIEEFQKIRVSVKVLVGFYIFLLIWWLIIFFFDWQNTTINYSYGFALGIFSLLGGIMGIVTSKKWGMNSSAVGRAILYLSAGLITWGIGTIIFAYYNLILNIPIPYPSVADVSYLLSWPLWSIGMINLSHATGMVFQLKKKNGKIFLYFVSFLAIIFSYYLLFIVARDGNIDFTGGILKLFFDLAYPIGDIFILTLALLVYGLSFNYLGGKMKIAIIIILIGFIFNYIADFSFSYTTTTESFFVANWVDMLFTITIFLMSIGINSLYPKVFLEKNKE